MRTNMNTRINGTNVILVPYQEKHVTKYHEWMKNPVLQHLTGSEPLTLEQEFEMQKRWLEDKDKCTFIILDKHIFLSTESEVDAMIGDTNLFFNDPQELCITEVEIMIADEASRGKKRGWESVILMMCYGVETLNVNKLCAKIKLDNAKSIKMFEKLGFQEHPYRRFLGYCEHIQKEMNACIKEQRLDDHRRKWNREEYERIALQRLQDEIAEEEFGIPKQPAVKRELLKQRDYKVDLESKLGKSVVINKNTPSSQTGGYYCNVCDCVVKDSINFLDHINGTKHQRNLGMSMKIERSTLEQVKARFAQNEKKLEEKKKDYDLEQRVKELKEEEEKIKEYRKEKRKDKKRKIEEMGEDDAGPSDEMAAIMGFSGFGSKKE